MEAVPTEPSIPPSESTNSNVSISEDSVRISSESLSTGTTMSISTSGSSTETSNDDSIISVVASRSSTETSYTDSNISVVASGSSTEISNIDSIISVVASGSSTETSNTDSNISVVASGSSTETSNNDSNISVVALGSSTETSNNDSTISVVASGSSTETSNNDSSISVVALGSSTETSNNDSNISVVASGSSTEISNTDSTISVTASGSSIETSNNDSTISVEDSGSSTETSNTESTISMDELTEPTNKVVDEQSLMVPEPEEPDLKKNLLLNLECPVCYDYMTPPISLCMNGHSVCHTCRPLLGRCPACRQGFLTTRNIVLENIAREMNLTSTRDSNQDLRERHVRRNPLTPRVYCPLRCSWSGEQGDLKAHIMEDHADCTLDDSGQEREHVKTWKLALRVTDKRVIIAQREVFLYRQKLNTLGRVFHVGVQYLGPVSNAASFKYEVELSADDDHQKFVKFCQTLGEDEDIEAAILTGNNCINVDYEIVKTFTSKKNFSFSVKISSW